MPKELLHWWLADQALQRLDDAVPLKRLLLEERHSYLTGAVLPDTLPHLIAGQYRSRAAESAERFHRPKGHSYAPLIGFLESHETQAADSRKYARDPSVSACLLGVATHIEADIAFHPLVYALSGDDIGRHYGVETDLDLWLLATTGSPPVLRLRSLLDSRARNAACTVAAGIFDPDETLGPAAIDRALALHALIQGMYGSIGWQALAWCLALLPVPFLRSNQRLFYPLCWRQGRMKLWPALWHDPVTGRDQNEQPRQLLTHCLERIGLLLTAADRQGLAAAFRQQPGEHLLTGLPPRSDHISTTAGAAARR